MSNGNSSYLRFSVEESIWFQKGHEVEELVSISLSPDVVIQETREYVLIRGSLELTGEYQSKLDMNNQPELSSSGEKFMEVLEVKENGNCFFRYYFPVDITIRREKIVSVHQVDFLVDNFDYTFPERSCLKLTANLLVTGLMEEQVTKQEVPNFSQPAIFDPQAQARKQEQPTPVLEVDNIVNDQEREVLFQEPVAVEQVEVEESNLETQASNLEEIIRQQTEELSSLVEVTNEEVLEERVVVEEDVVEEVVYEQRQEVEEELNNLEIEVVFEEQPQVYRDEVIQEEEHVTFEEVEEEVYVTYEETAENRESIHTQVEEQAEIAYEDTTEEAYPVYEEVTIATFPVYEETVTESVVEVVEEVVMVEEVAPVEEVEVTPTPPVNKSRFGFDIFLSNKNKKDKSKEETAEAKKEEAEQKNSKGKVALTEFFSSKTEETNVKLKLYFIQPNDTLETIAEKYDTTLINLLKYNKLDTASQLTPGEILYVPKVTVKK